MNDRNHQLALILGAPNSGKTTLFETLIQRYDGEVLILDPNANFVGDPRAVWPMNGNVEEYLVALKADRERKGFPPFLLGMDDADKYLSGGTAPKGIYRDLFTSFRHWHCDLLLNSRRTQGIPKDVVESAGTLYLFRSREVHGKAYLEKMLGKQIMAHVPTEPYVYLRVEPDSGSMWRGHTTKRSPPTLPAF